FLITAHDVTSQVLANQQAEAEHKSLLSAHEKIDSELLRLVAIESTVRNVLKAQSYPDIARVAVETLVEAFSPICACIHIARPDRQELQLAHLYINQEQATSDLQTSGFALEYIPYDSPFWLAKARLYQEPLVIDSLQRMPGAQDAEKSTLEIPFAGGYVCIPLRLNDYFEGTLLLLFQESVDLRGPLLRTLTDCSKYIGAALARTRLHTEVENQHTRLRAVLDHLPEGVFLVEAKDMRIGYANEAASHILGLPRERLLNLSLWDAHTTRRHLYRLSSLQEADQELEKSRVPTLRALAGETVVGEEVVFTRADAKQLTLLCSAAPIRNEGDTITGAVAIFQDITARKSLEEQKNEFLSIASHELRTPIAAIQGFAEIVQLMSEQGMNLNSPHTHQAIDGIIEQSERLTRLIDEIMDLSRVQHTLLTLNKAPHDLIGTLKRAKESMAAAAGKQHTLVLNLQGLDEQDSLIAEYDEGRLLQVLNNLLSNAFKYSHTKSKVEIGLSYAGKQAEKVRLWVRDWGIGIPEHDLLSIFKRFHRASNFDRSISGLGIGLYLAHEIIIQHGGFIWVESKEGEGSTFIIELPLIQSEDA
ncbi:MAG TPA: ATP-binding protein, partial [Ktedonobacteraceae bacterium]|nr:ATP-binding protein [Ktedonobacteraceae bacterium]